MKFISLILTICLSSIIVGNIKAQCPLVIKYDNAGNRVYRGNDCDPDCSLIVTTLLDDGVGSLRRAIQCAPDGATITFAPHIIGQFINLTSGHIPINKNLFIMQTSSTIVNVNQYGSGPVFEITTGATELSYMQLSGSDENGKEGRALINRGDLLLDNVTIIDPDTAEGTGGSSVINYGNIQITGNTKIIIGITF